jgi:predicted nucleotidyltransferase
VTLSDNVQKLLYRAANTKKKLERQLYVAAAISGSFEEQGIPAVLVGGTVVEYYTAGGYTTGDIDMVLPPLEKREFERVMQDLGFERFEDYRHWLHPKIPVPVEFPPGPLQVGHLPVQEVNEIEIGKIKLKILRVEDILLDRLIMAQEWKDLQAQAQSEMLMDAHYVKMDWRYIHQKASQLGVFKLLQEIQRKAEQRLRNKK